MTSTMRACTDVSFDESEMHRVLSTATHYSLRNGTLYLNIGNQTPLAVFEDNK